MNARLIIKYTGSLLLARWKNTLSAAMGVVFSLTFFIALFGLLRGPNDLQDELSLKPLAPIELSNDANPGESRKYNHHNAFKATYGSPVLIKESWSPTERIRKELISQIEKSDSPALAIDSKKSAPVFVSRWLLQIHKDHR